MLLFLGNNSFNSDKKSNIYIIWKQYYQAESRKTNEEEDTQHIYSRVPFQHFFSVLSALNCRFNSLHAAATEVTVDSVYFAQACAARHNTEAIQSFFRPPICLGRHLDDW